ncbi:MAG: hypothetical protein QOE45_1054 [Frankiaceae bacterium]|jgi:hypothetical protein|nr:hypothetical protein [Frankiaceae bacterium]
MRRVLATALAALGAFGLAPLPHAGAQESIKVPVCHFVTVVVYPHTVVIAGVGTVHLNGHKICV